MQKKNNIKLMVETDSEEGQELLKFAEVNGIQVTNEDELLEECTQRWVRMRKRPMLTLILGSSVLSEKHFDDLESLLSGESFDDLDCLIQVVAGDVKIAAKIAKLIRSKVSGKLTGVLPIYTSAPGCILSLGMDELIGGETTSFGPLDIANIHIGVYSYYQQTGELPPMFKEEIYKEVYLDAHETARKMLGENNNIFSGNVEEFLNHLRFEDGMDAVNAFNLKTLKKFGLNANLHYNNQQKAFDSLSVGIAQMLSDLIQVIK